MFLINFIIIIFLSTLIYRSTELICNTNNARDFLEKIRYVPTVPWKVPAFSIFLLVVMFFSSIARQRIVRENKKSVLVIILSILDLGLSIAISYYLNMSYKGIVLLAIANFIIYMDGKKKKFLFLITAVIVYIFLDYDIISINFNLFSINVFVEYYTTAQRFYIFGIKNIFTSLNEIGFIFLMIFLIQSQVDEKTKIKDLYLKLSKTAEELKIANIQLQEYSVKSEEMAKIKERNRLAREIHDTIGHTLTGISTGLEACTELINWDIEKAKLQIAKISDLAQKGLLDVRRSVRELRPDALERFSLIPAIQKLCEDINNCARVRVELTVLGEEKQLNADEEETIYRVVQEGITNAVRHGEAKSIKITLIFTYGAVNLSIIDNGIGCKTINEGFGIKHIRERVEMLGGSVEFINDEDGGFHIKASIPIRWGVKQ